MTAIQIPAGAIVIATPNPEANGENRYRLSNGGARLLAPWEIWVHGQRDQLGHLHASGAVLQEWKHHDDASAVTYRLSAFDWELTESRSAFAVDKFPHAWAPRTLAESIGAWVETTAGAVFTAVQGETVPRKKATAKRRTTRAVG